MAKSYATQKSYAAAVEFYRSGPRAQSIVHRNARCQLRAVARRIAPSDGAKLDLLRVPWRCVRWIAQGRGAAVRAQRLEEVLARYPAPA